LTCCAGAFDSDGGIATIPTRPEAGMRRSLGSVLATLGTLAAVGTGGPAAAQQKTLYLAAYGGSFETTMRQEIMPAFEKKYGVKLDYVAGNSTDNLAKLQAQKGNQQIDVAILDDGPMYQAAALGFCRDLDKSAIYGDLYDVARMPSGKATNIGVVGTGIMYNAKAFQDAGWALPSSWEDLKDPKFRKKLVVPPLNNTYGLHALVLMAKQRGGGTGNIDPGFKAFKDEIGPNVLAYEPSPGKMTELFQSNQAVIAVWGSGRAKALADTGFPAAFVYPKEGGMALGLASCPIAGGKNHAEAQRLVEFFLEPEIQVILATKAGSGPVNKKVVLTPEQAVGLPYGPAQVDKLAALDWDVVNAKREEWNRRWTREIER
jgi:putative spermidine/putrescine transport system substrate-binding protein